MIDSKEETKMNNPTVGDGDLDDLIFQDAWQISDR